MPLPLAIPAAGWVLEAAAAAAARWAVGTAARAAVGAATTTAVVGVATLPGDTPVDQDKDRAQATPTDRSLSRTDEKCDKCPADAGARVVRNHGVNHNAYGYQARITGFGYDVKEGRWSEEWQWLGRDFDGFVQAQCLLQEAKGNYDQWLDGSIKGSDNFFKGFERLSEQATEQATLVLSNPPTRLCWYFQTPLTYQKMQPILASLRVESEHRP